MNVDAVDEVSFCSFAASTVIRVAKIINWGGLKFNKSYSPAGRDSDNFGRGYADLI